MKRWMRPVPVALALGAMLAGSAAAQGGRGGQQAGQQQEQAASGLVTGRVTVAGTEAPLPNAQVFVVGAQVGAITNAEGRYSITGVPAGSRIVRFQSVGYGTLERAVEVPASTSVTVDFVVRQQAIAIDPVVVTALGIQRAERSLGYAVQTVGRDLLERSPEMTFVDALASQTAGTHVTRSSGQPGGSSRLVIRGEASFRGDGQPLFVVDGVPIINDIDRNSYDPLMRGEATSRLVDIDPANIEEISVLRGAAATALYGSRAALGAVIIRTRQGTPGSPLKISYSSRVGYEDAILEGLQQAWAGGLDGYFCNGRPVDDGGWCQPGYPLPNPNPVVNTSWGPHRDSIPAIVIQNSGPVLFRDPRADFLKTGRVSSHSIYGTGSLAGGTYGIGFSYANHSGVMVQSKLDRLNLNVNMGFNLRSNLSSNTTILHANTINDLGWEGVQGLGSRVSLMPPTQNLSDPWNEDGSPVLFGADDPHPQWVAENEYASAKTARWIASQMFALSFGPGLTLSNRIGLDTYLDDRREHQNERPWLTAAGLPSGGTRQQKITRRSINNDLVLTVHSRRLGEGPFGVNGLVGGNLYSAEVSDISGWGFNMSIPGFYRLSNFTTRERRHTLPIQRRIVGAYTQWTFDYNEYAFLTLTGRNDWSSTLSLDDNAIFYPSASLALVFTDALGWSGSVLDYGKVRLSLAKVGSDAPPYRLTSAYEVASLTDWSGGASTPVELGFPFRGVKGYLQSTERGNPDIKPESTVEAELGFELHWLGGRVRTDISLYNRRSFDQIFSVPAAASTGFTSLTQNAGDLTNRGIEFSLGMTPIRTNDLLWDVRLNATRNWSRVDELTEDVDYIYLAGPGAPRQDYFLYLEAPDLPQVRIVSGESYGVIWGRGYQRNENGQLLIGADGFPLVEDDQLLGTISPTFLGNVNSSLRWRSLTLSGLFEIRRGGEIMNTDLLFTIPAGTAKITEQRNDSYVFDGVNAATGQPNTTSVIRDRDFWTRYANVHENLIESADVARLREATLAFRLPDAISGKLQAQSMSAFVTGRNLVIWAPFSYGDPDGSNYGAVNAGGSAYRFFTTPTTRTYSIGVRATF